MDENVDPCAEPRAGVDCSQAVEVLYHYLDGELTEERRGLIGRHLDACHHCLEAFEFEVELRTLIAQKCREQAPEDLRHRIADLLAKEAAEAGTPFGGPSLGNA